MRYIVIGALILIVATLASALYYLYHDRGQGMRMVRALAIRVALKLWLAITIVLGFTFLGLQIHEYTHAYSELNLKLSTGVYGSTFFMLTGFHGFHVTIGAIMLSVMLGRAIRGHFDAEHHFAFEAAAWYWHFVDVVWLLLFILVYWL